MQGNCKMSVQINHIYLMRITRTKRLWCISLDCVCLLNSLVLSSSGVRSDRHLALASNSTVNNLGFICDGDISFLLRLHPNLRSSKSSAPTHYTVQSERCARGSWLHRVYAPNLVVCTSSPLRLSFCSFLLLPFSPVCRSASYLLLTGLGGACDWSLL